MSRSEPSSSIVTAPSMSSTDSFAVPRISRCFRSPVPRSDGSTRPNGERCLSATSRSSLAARSLRRSCAASTRGWKRRSAVITPISTESMCARITPIAGFRANAPSSRSDSIAKIRFVFRKPEPGLILQAQRDLNIDLASSWYIGDSTPDLGAAEKAGVSSILVETGHGGLDRRHPYEARFTVANVSEAVTFILDVYPKIAERLAPQVAAMASSDDWFVGGLPSAGKSTVAATLERELRLQGRRARIIHTDRWVQDDPDRHALASFDMGSLKAAVAIAAERAKTQSVTMMLPAGRE